MSYIFPTTSTQKESAFIFLLAFHLRFTPRLGCSKTRALEVTFPSAGFEVFTAVYSDESGPTFRKNMSQSLGSKEPSRTPEWFR
jgi:hypothetical protein